VQIIEKTFDIGEVIVTKIMQNSKMIGDFTIIMPRDKKYTATHFVEIYTRQIGMVLTRRAIEFKLRESEANYRSLFTEMQGGFAVHQIICDNNNNPIDYITLDVNHTFELLLNAKKENVVGVEASQILPKEELNRWVEIFGSVALTGKSQKYELYSDFNQKYFEGTAYCPEKYKFATIFFDVTERKEMERRLVESEERQREIIENSEAGYFFLDTIGLIQHVNSAWLKMHKYENQEEIIGKHYSVTQLESDLPIANSIVEKILENKKVLSGDFSRRCKDRTVGFHTFSARPVLKNGEIIGIEVFLIDTTERHITEEKLRASEQRYKLLISEMQQGLAVHEIIQNDAGQVIDYRFLDANESFEKLTGLKRTEILGKRVLEVLPNTEHYWIENYGKVALTGEPLHFENYHQELNRYYEVVAYRPQEKQFAVIVTDISDRKKNELQMKNQLDFQNMMNDILTYKINTPIHW